MSDDFPKCPRCGQHSYPVHRGADHFEACDSCRAYWYVGSCLVRPFAERVHAGEMDSEIGGPQERVRAIAVHYLSAFFALDAILEEYEQWNPE